MQRGLPWGRCEAKTGIAAFGRLVEQVMSQVPYRSARRVFWIVDNGSSHRGRKATDRLQKQYPNLILVHTPVHASWLNQQEIYFGIIQRKVLTPAAAHDLSELERRILAFEARSRAQARPFAWRFTRVDFERRLRELAASPLTNFWRGPLRVMTPRHGDPLLHRRSWRKRQPQLPRIEHQPRDGRHGARLAVAGGLGLG